MMGSIQKINRSKPWRARYRDPRGVEHSQTFLRKYEAQQWLTAQESAIQRGEWVSPTAGATKVSEIAERWHAGRKANKRPSTVARDRSMLDRQIIPHLGSLPVKAVRPSTLQTWLAALSDEYAPATVRKAHQLVGQIFDLAVRDRLVAVSPVEGLELPAVKRDEPRFLDVPEILELADSLGPDRGMVLLGGLAGLRIGEVLGLKVSDVDFLGRAVTVRRTAVEAGKGGIRLGEPKTAKSRRRIAVPQLVIDELSAASEGLGPDDLLYSDDEGGPRRRTSWARYVFGPKVRGLGLEPLRFHDLRHSHVALLIAQGEHPRAIADRLGHSSVSTILDTYGHLFPGIDEGIADRLSDALAAQGGHKTAGGKVVELPRKAETP